MERIIGYHWFGGVEPLAFWIEWKTSRHSIVRGSAVARAQQNLLLTSLPISPLKFGQTSLVVANAHGNQLWSSQLRPWIFEAQQIQRRKLVERSPWRCSHEIISCNAWKRSRKETPSSACPQAVMGQQNMMMFMDFPHYSHHKKDEKSVSRTYFQVCSIYFGLANWRFQMFGDDWIILPDGTKAYYYPFLSGMNGSMNVHLPTVLMFS